MEDKAYIDNQLAWVEKLATAKSEAIKELLYAKSDASQKLLEASVAGEARLRETELKLVSSTVESLGKIVELTRELGDIAINKSEVSLHDKMEQANHKYTLLKEQSVSFITRTEMDLMEKKVELNSKLIYIGIGGILVLEFIAKFLFK
jgi:hypothetical protein